eukprot:CAMPEP_0185772798 /NCGR_PEP_ID=MMETSP1174-20130828/70950_1 /TAXON_ID=35687 /ORGANISM="Dictyocha speculum, Strain CCMP1381" /LENGTH=40 /DNA_ID= /DNA_START= /DNA_END= /DNA_ORIENTATION=
MAAAKATTAVMRAMNNCTAPPEVLVKAKGSSVLLTSSRVT